MIISRTYTKVLANTTIQCNHKSLIRLKASVLLGKQERPTLFYIKRNAKASSKIRKTKAKKPLKRQWNL